LGGPNTQRKAPCGEGEILVTWEGCGDVAICKIELEGCTHRYGTFSVNVEFINAEDMKLFTRIREIPLDS